MDTPLAAETVLHIGSFAITNSLLMSWLVISTLIILALVITSKVSLIPGALQNGAEFVIESIYNLTESVAPTYARVFFPIIATFFIFILASNWFGLLPGLNAIGFNEIHAGQQTFVPFFRSAGSDLNVTLGLALVSVILTQFFGLRFRGLFGYIKHYFHNPLHGGIALILLGSLLALFLGGLELVAEFVKVISLSFRLFGNVYAGEVVIHTISGIASYIVPVPFLLLETIVGFVQAIVFSLLTLVFFSIMSEPAPDHT